MQVYIEHPYYKRYVSFKVIPQSFKLDPAGTKLSIFYTFLIIPVSS